MLKVVRLPLRISNVWLVDAAAEGRWLVDCGHPVERRLLLRALSRLGLSPGRLAGVLLTHRHSDHAGNAAFLAQRHQVPVHALGADAAILRGDAPRPRMPRGDSGVFAAMLTEFENRAPARCPTTRDLADGQHIAGLEVLAMPGHTEGSAFFWHAPSQSLFSGDMILNAVPPLTVKTALCLPHPTFTSDLALAMRSLRAFHERALPFERLFPGHGPAIESSAAERFGRLLAQMPPPPSSNSGR